MSAEHPIRKWRKASRLSLEDLATRVGIQAPHLCEIELRKKTPSVAVARKIAAETGLSRDDVLKP